MSGRFASPAVMATRLAVDRSLGDLPPGASVVVACSGGPDSLALAGATAWAAPRRGLSTRAVIIDHGLQDDSADVAARAARQCTALGLDHAEVIPVDVGSRGGPEAAARTARYRALTEAAQRSSAAVVLVGHTLDDQAETVLLRLARGSGARALSAMRPRSDPWRRPFLGLARAEVHAAAADMLGPLGEAPWADPQNADSSFARVRVRALLAGLGEALGPGAVLGLSRSAELLHDDAEALDALADAAFHDLAQPIEAGLQVECSDLRDLPRAIRTRVIRLVGLHCGCPSEDFGYDHVLQIEALIVDWHGQGDLSLPGRVTAGRLYDRLWFRTGPTR